MLAIINNLSIHLNVHIQNNSLEQNHTTYVFQQMPNRHTSCNSSMHLHLSLNSSPFAMHTRHLKCIPNLHHLQISSSSTNAASQTPETFFALSWHLASRQIQN
ncbi:hypothetical protein NW767_013132 [Fusarium falciforme]|nr:hypothetical protein NW767_013132 [Fusarium falciforme]